MNVGRDMKRIGCGIVLLGFRLEEFFQCAAWHENVEAMALRSRVFG